MLFAPLLLAAAAAPAPASPPPSSVAVTFDRTHTHVVLAEGLADRATGRAVTARDPVRIASISKLVMTLGVMRLVDAHKLDLDRDVSAYLGWPLRNPSFPDVPITLRQLLSHTSSVTDGADYAVPLGESLRHRLADPRAWDAAHAPGSDWFHYTNLNFPIVASVMEKVTGERFDRLIQRLVMRPLKLSACYNWSPCTGEAAARAVVLYRADGSVAKDDLGGKLPDCPVQTAPGVACDLASYRLGDNGALFSPQGGLRISMLDLAKIGQVLARRGGGLISRRAYETMVKPQWRFTGTNGTGEAGEPLGYTCAYGLAVQTLVGKGPDCHDQLFADGRLRIGHPGGAYALKSGLWVDPKTGKGIAFFTTALPDDAPTGRSAFTARAEGLVARALHQP